jgi:hypothetical protein
VPTDARPPSQRLSRAVAAVAGAAALAVATVAVPVLRPYYETWRDIRTLGSTDDDTAEHALAALEAREVRYLRPFIRSYCAALDRFLASSLISRSIKYQIGRDSALVAHFEAIAREDPRLLVPALEGGAGPYAFHALLLAGRLNLACPKARTLVVRGNGASPGWIGAFEWGGSTLPASGDEVIASYGSDGERDAFEFHLPSAAHVDLGDIPLEQAEAPRTLGPPIGPFGDDWLHLVPVRLGHTYALTYRARRSAMRLSVAFRVIEHVEGDHVKLEWLILEVRRIPGRMGQ